MSWFKKEWLKGDHRAVSVYLGLLFYRLIHYHRDKVLNVLRVELLKRFKGRIFKEAESALKDFIEALVSNKAWMELDEIEKAYYDRFKGAYLKYVKIDALSDYTKGLTYAFLEELKEGKIPIDGYSKMGSKYIFLNFTRRNYIERILGYDIMGIIPSLHNSNVIFEWRNHVIIPASVLDSSFIEKLIS